MNYKAVSIEAQMKQKQKCTSVDGYWGIERFLGVFTLAIFSAIFAF